jgi:EAL domain-containing protein (putative c-di-GMP-specific phosphodiesterase class I)
LKNGIPLQNWLLSTGGKYALDDFGKGLSNFDRLSQLEVDLVKFDHTLIKDILGNTRQRAAIRHVTALCDELDIGVIAEGVETVEQESALLELGVFAHQGFLRGKPMKKSEFFTLLRSETQVAKPPEGSDGQNLGGNHKATVQRSL